jgi:hypothetical protein
MNILMNWYKDSLKETDDDKIMGVPKSLVTSAIRKVFKYDYTKYISDTLIDSHLRYVFLRYGVEYLAVNWIEPESRRSFILTEVSTERELGYWLITRFLGEQINITDVTPNVHQFIDRSDKRGYMLNIYSKKEDGKEFMQLVATESFNAARSTNVFSPVHVKVGNSSVQSLFRMCIVNHLRYIAGMLSPDWIGDNRNVANAMKYNNQFGRDAFDPMRTFYLFFFGVNGFMARQTFNPESPEDYVLAVKDGFIAYVKEVVGPNYARMISTYKDEIISSNNTIKEAVNGTDVIVKDQECAKYSFDTDFKLEDAYIESLFYGRDIYSAFEVPFIVAAKNRMPNEESEEFFNLTTETFKSMATHRFNNLYSKLSKENKLLMQNVERQLFPFSDIRWVNKQFQTLQPKTLVSFFYALATKGTDLNFKNPESKTPPSVPMMEDVLGYDLLSMATAELTEAELECYEIISGENSDLEATYTLLNKDAPAVSIFSKLNIVNDSRVDLDMVKLIHDLREEWLSSNGVKASAVSLSDGQITIRKKLEKLITKIFNFKNTDIDMTQADLNAATIAFAMFIENDYYTPEEIKAGVWSIDKKGIRFKKGKLPAYILLNRGLLVNSLITDRECVGILLHEIGHQFEFYSDWGMYDETRKRYKLANKLAFWHATICLAPALMAYVINPLMVPGLIPFAMISLGDIMASYINLLALQLNMIDMKNPDKVIKELRKVREEYEKKARELYDQENELAGAVAFGRVVWVVFTFLIGVEYLFLFIKSPLISWGNMITQFITPYKASDFWHGRLSGKLHRQKEYESDSMATAYGYGADVQMALVKMRGQKYDQYNMIQKIMTSVPIINILFQFSNDVYNVITMLIQGGASHPGVNKRIDATIDRLTRMKGDAKLTPDIEAKLDADIAELERIKKLNGYMNPYLQYIGAPIPAEAKKIRDHYAEQAAPLGMIIDNDVKTKKKKRRKKATNKSVAEDVLKVYKDLKKRKGNFMNIGADKLFDDDGRIEVDSAITGFFNSLPVEGWKKFGKHLGYDTKIAKLEKFIRDAADKVR